MEKFSPALQHRPLMGESNLSILKDISKSETDSATAYKAFNEFYFRFYQYVWNMAYRVCSRFSKEASLAEDLFQEIFKRVYLKAKLLIQGKEAEISDVTIKAWLGRIANRILIDYIRQNKVENDRTDFIIDTHDNLDFQYSDLPDEKTDVNVFKLEACIAALEPRERDILYLYIYNTERKVGTQDLQVLAEKYGVTTETIRKTYYRTIEMLQKQLKN